MCAGSQQPRPTSGTVIKFEESPTKTILYVEESGGLITSLPKALDRDKRAALPKMNRDGKSVNLLPLRPELSAKANQGPSKEIRTAPPNIPQKAPQVASQRAPVKPPPPIAPATQERTAASPQVATVKTEDSRALYDQALASWRADPLPALVRAQNLEQQLGSAIVNYKDRSAALALGWAWLEGGTPAKAENWFTIAHRISQDDESLRGLMIATLAQRKFASAIELASQLPNDSAIAKQVRRDSWAGIGEQDYQLGRYTSALQAFEQAATEGELPRHVRMLSSWAQMKSENKQAAQQGFLALYSEAPDMESAQGLVSALPDELPAAVRRVADTEPLASLLRKQTASNAFRTKRYLTAARMDPDQWEPIVGLSTPSAGGAFATRNKAGDQGLGRLVAQSKLGLDASAPIGNDAAVSITSDKIRLNAGNIGTAAIVGSALPTPLATSTATNANNILETEIALRLERSVILAIKAGTGPQHGLVSARPTGSIDVSGVGSQIQWEARLYAEPVRESVLAWTGMRDPYTGNAWGGVQKTGAEGRALYLGSPPWSAGVGVRAETLAGNGVANNSRRAIDAGVGRDLGLSGFAYSSLGLTAAYDSYEKNLSRYTLGHGGYFSPQSFRKLGAAFDFMTQEGKQWLIRGRFAGGRTFKVEDASPYLPLNPDGRTYARSQSTGHEASARLSAVAQLLPQLQLALSLSRSTSPQYVEKSAVIEFRILFDRRRGVTTADLPNRRGG